MEKRSESTCYQMDVFYAGLEQASDMKADELANLLCGLVITSGKVRSTGIIICSII